MSTHPIPAGTCNFPTNLPHELRRPAGRYAFERGLSLGRWIRNLISREGVRIWLQSTRRAEK